MKEVHTLACFVHGMAAALHIIGIVYNIRRRNWFDVAAHAFSVTYGIRSVHNHYVDVKRG